MTRTAWVHLSVILNLWPDAPLVRDRSPRSRPFARWRQRWSSPARRSRSTSIRSTTPMATSRLPTRTSSAATRPKRTGSSPRCVSEASSFVAHAFSQLTFRSRFVTATSTRQVCSSAPQIPLHTRRLPLNVHSRPHRRLRFDEPTLVQAVAPDRLQEPYALVRARGREQRGWRARHRDCADQRHGAKGKSASPIFAPALRCY